MQFLALIHALTLAAFRLDAVRTDWVIVNLIEEVLSGQGRAAGMHGWDRQGLLAGAAARLRHLVLRPCLGPPPHPFYVLSPLSSSMLLRPSLGHQRGPADSSWADGGADGWRRPLLMLFEQETMWRGRAGVV